MVDIMWNPLGSAIGFEEVINNHLKIMGEVCQNIGCVFRLEGLAEEHHSHAEERLGDWASPEVRQ